MTRIVVVGDTLLDRDVRGTVDRLCPDAPVPVVDEVEVHDRPGGAGLAAMLLAQQGITTSLICALADDEGARRLRDLLERRGIEVLDCGHSGTTPEKIRIRAAEQSLVRWDRGTSGPVGPPPEAARQAIAAADGVLVSDYGRGVASQERVRALVESAVTAGTPVVWDPHPRGGAPVRGCTMACPNRREAESFAALDTDATPLPRATADARRLHHRWAVGHVAVTLGRDGALLVNGDGAPLVVPVDERVDGGDSCGAGDSFAAAAVRSLARGALPSEAVIDAVAAAARFVAAGGAAAMGRTDAGPPSAPDGRLDRAHPGRTVVATGGCFDILHPGHVATLERARRLGDHLVVLVNSDRSVRRLKGPDRPVQPESDRAAVLASLACVDDVVVFDEDTPVEALRSLRPDIFVKGGDYIAGELPETAAMAEWGGTVVTVPFVDGRSTTRILDRSPSDPLPVPGGSHVV